jgi:hypothetical protein
VFNATFNNISGLANPTDDYDFCFLGLANPTNDYDFCFLDLANPTDDSMISVF